MDASEQDREDDRLLAAGDHDALLARHYPAVIERLRLRMPEGDALDVAHETIQRLLEELDRGRRYRVPFRVVVHQIVGWKLKEHFRDRSGEATALEDDLVAPDELESLRDRLDVTRRLEALPEGERRTLSLRYLEGLEISEIATRLDMTRNAVDQALHRGHRRLRRNWNG